MIDTQIAPTSADRHGHDQLLEEAARHMFVLKRVMRRMLQQARARAGSPEEANMGEAQIQVLHALHDGGQLTAGDLADRCRVADPTMSKTLNHLEAQGLVVRRTDPTNRRVVQVTLTVAGQERLQQAQTEWTRNLAQVLYPLTNEQLHDLITGLSHLESLVDSDEHETRPSPQGVK